MDIRHLEKRFFALNRARLWRVRETLRPRQWDFLQLLPLLFHVNHPMLPGYVCNDAPAGVSGYTPSRRAFEAARRISRSFPTKRRALRHYDIYSLFLTGSAGTVAYSDDSDLDIWVCHHAELDDAQRAKLARKAEAIRQWAEGLELEVHFFLFDEPSFRSQQHGRATEQSSGTAQHHLLLEEFYRTGLLVAGRYPIWWLVPPEAEADYENYVSALRRKRFVREGATVDFGAVAPVPAEEFFGAALWQLFKGIDSPYKSVLKILLMEAYASEYPNIDLLSLRFKKHVHRNRIEMVETDPYILMCNKVEEYLLPRKDYERVELARRCLYFKVGIRMSDDSGGGAPDWQRKIVEKLISTWGWDEARLLILDSRPTWKVQRVLDERRLLVNELMNSYRLLSGSVRRFATSAAISQRDLTVLGRKLYAAFEHKAGKIDLINPGISEGLAESRISIHQDVDNPETWLLFRNDVKPDQARRATPLIRTRSIMELLAWCHFNGIVDRSTIITLFAERSHLTLKEVKALLRCMQRVLARAVVDHARLEDFDRPARTSATAIFVNVGVDPHPSLSRQGKQLISDRTDAFRYGGLSRNMVLTFDQVLMSSWHEVFTKRYLGVDGVLDCLCDYVSAHLQGECTLPPEVPAFSFSSNLGVQISNRVQDLFRDVIRCYFGEAEPKSVRYMLPVEEGYFLLQIQDQALGYRALQDTRELTRELSQPMVCYSPVVFDTYAGGESPLPLIYSHSAAGKIQLFYHPAGTQAAVYVVDERGSLFTQTVPYHTARALLNQYDLFFASVAQRLNVLLEGSAAESGSIHAVEYYRLEGGPFAGWRALPQDYSPLSLPSKFFSIQVILDEHGKDHSCTVYCDGRDFSSLEYGSSVFERVARHIVEHRQTGEPYPIYITDIDLSRTEAAQRSPRSMQTLHYLQQKQAIERSLNDALAASCRTVRTPTGSC